LKPFYYDLKRALRSKTVVVLVALMIVASFTFVPFMRQAVGPRGGFLPLFLAYDHDASGYHFLTFTADEFGQPIQANTMISLGNGFQAPSSYTLQLKPNVSGVALGTVTAPNGSYDFLIRTGVSGWGSHLPDAADGVVKVSVPWYAAVSDPGGSSVGRLLVFWAGDGLSAPVGYKVTYKITGGTLTGSQNLTEEKPLGTLQGYAAVYSLPKDFSLSGVYMLTFYIHSPDGTLVSQSAPLGNGFFVGQGARYETESITSYLFTGMFAVLVPLLSLLGAYNVYGKDRAAGILKSVLARPISRAGLLASRYLAIVCALTGAVTVTVLTANLLVYWTVGVAFSPYYMVGTIASMVVEVCAFVGIGFVLAHLLKGTGTIMMASMAIFLALVLFWGFAVSGLLAPMPFPGSQLESSTVQLQIITDFVNPGQFMALMSTFILGTVKTSLGQNMGGLQMPVAAFGLTIWTLAADGLVWVALPLLVALRLAKRRD
jgi:ABC-type transport system involved in multi-copper enzyme maturation permease subunit